MRARVLSAVLAGLILLAVVFWSGPLPVVLLLSLAVAIATAELLALQELPGYPLVGGCVGMLYATNQSVWTPTGWWAAAVGGLLQAVGVGALMLSGDATWKQQSRLWLGLAYVVSPVAAVFGLHQMGTPVQDGWHFANPLLVLLVPVWAGDTAGMLVGRKYGRRLLAPSVSPKKTVEGAWANGIAATLGGLGIAAGLGVPLLAGGLCGLLCGTLGQVGDLFESSLKRRAGVKDSGKVLPGHGGLLDRIDALLFCAWPVFAVLLAFS